MPSIMDINKTLHATASALLLDDNDALNEDASMEIAAEDDDGEAISAANIVTFEAGDIIGKVLALVAQVHYNSLPLSHRH